MAEQEKNQGEPVALPDRQTEDHFSEKLRDKAEGWNACLDEIAKLGPLFSRPVQGEPVAWMDPRSPKMHATISNEVKQHNLKFGGAPASAVNGYTIPLYTHVDPGEFEQLREENRVLQKQLGERWADIDTLRAQLAEARELLQRAERVVEAADRLEREAFKRGAANVGAGLLRGMRVLIDQYGSALSASAEPSSKQEFREHLDKCAVEVESWPAWKREALKHPSAPVKRDERAAFETHTRRECHDADLECYGGGIYRNNEVRDQWAGWQARAALERKP